jgi:hypothetical protein
MARAGYCASCQADVWLNEDGSCQNGHPSEDVSAVREVEPVAPEPIPDAHTPKPKRRGLLVGGAIAVVLVVLGLCAAIVLLGMPLAKQGSAATDEWTARLAKDYPGWKVAGFNVRSFSGSGGSQTEYAFSLVPPGRDFTVGVVYKSEDGKPAVSQDEMLRPGSQYNSRAKALLDFIEKTYVSQGRDVVSVTTDPDGSATVNWQKVTQILFFTSRVGSFDRLSYDEGSGTWSASPGMAP